MLASTLDGFLLTHRYLASDHDVISARDCPAGKLRAHCAIALAYIQWTFLWLLQFKLYDRMFYIILQVLRQLRRGFCTIVLHYSVVTVAIPKLIPHLWITIIIDIILYLVANKIHCHILSYEWGMYVSSISVNSMNIIVEVRLARSN